METIETILQLVTPNCYMTILDLSDAYLTISVRLGGGCLITIPLIDHQHKPHDCAAGLIIDLENSSYMWERSGCCIVASMHSSMQTC